MIDITRLASAKADRMRRDFLSYCRHALAPEGLEPARHHRMMIAAIQRLVDGEIDRLMLLMPPGTAKSKYASMLLPGWFLAQRPRLTMIAASNTSDLAGDFANKAQSYLRDQRDILGYDLRRARSDLWECTNGGEYKAVGCTSAIAGRRGDLAVIDDPFGGRKAADSPATRKEVWDWYRGDLIGRMKPGGRIMLVNCMVGGTRVLMADGQCRDLRDIRAGDCIATYDEGNLAISRVNNWKSSGIDDVFQIKTTSGASTVANGRHPFF